MPSLLKREILRFRSIVLGFPFSLAFGVSLGLLESGQCLCFLLWQSCDIAPSFPALFNFRPQGPSSQNRAEKSLGGLAPWREGGLDLVGLSMLLRTQDGRGELGMDALIASQFPSLYALMGGLYTEFLP